MGWMSRISGICTSQLSNIWSNFTRGGFIDSRVAPHEVIIGLNIGERCPFQLHPCPSLSMGHLMMLNEFPSAGLFHCRIHKIDPSRNFFMHVSGTTQIGMNPARPRNSIVWEWVLLFAVITAFLFAQWSVTHIHLTSSHAHDNILHDHLVVQHAHQLMEQWRDDSRTHWNHRSETKIIDLNEEYRLQKHRKFASSFAITVSGCKTAVFCPTCQTVRYPPYKEHSPSRPLYDFLVRGPPASSLT